MVSSRDYALILSDGPMESLTLRARFSLRAYGKILDVRRLRGAAGICTARPGHAEILRLKRNWPLPEAKGAAVSGQGGRPLAGGLPSKHMETIT